MILKDILEKIITYHIMIEIINKDGSMSKYMYDTPSVNGIGVDNMEVINIYARNEIEAETPITHTTCVRPIVVVVVRDK